MVWTKIAIGGDQTQRARGIGQHAVFLRIGEALLGAIVEDVLGAVLADTQRRLDLDDLTERIDLRPAIDRPLDDDAHAVALAAILMAAVVPRRAVARMRHLDEVAAARCQI